MDRKVQVLFTVVLLAIFVGGVVGLTRYVEGRQAAQATPTAAPSAANEPTDLGVPAYRVMGEADAPVTIVDFSNFLCPHCSRFAQTTKKKIEEAYVRTGKVRFVYRHLVFTDPNGNGGDVLAALASDCAGEQGRFWDFHDALFEVQRQAIDKGGFTVQDLTGLAGDLGLDTATFGACLVERQPQDRILSDLRDAQKLGVQGTPTFFINGRKVVGNQPYEVFQGVIEDALKGAGGR